MNRADLREKFRAENPELTTRVVTDATLNSWMLTSNKEVCCETRCIMTNASEIIDSVVDVQYYDLETQISNFLDIDDMPGGGVYYDDKPLKKVTAGEMNYIKGSWKDSASGTPERYWRRGKYLWFDVAPDTSAVEIAVDCILKPDDFDSDTKEPFNQLGYLQDYSDAISKYLQWRTKQKVGKQDEAAIAFRDYTGYVKWMKKRVKSAKLSAIFLRP